MQSPTPVTVIGAESIERNAQLNLGDEIRDLPYVGGTPTQSANTQNISQANAGVDTLSLRGLGGQRNLVLFDNSKLSPPYLRWIPLVEPLTSAMKTLGEITVETCDLLFEPPSNHARRISDWKKRGIDAD